MEKTLFEKTGITFTDIKKLEDNNIEVLYHHSRVMAFSAYIESKIMDEKREEVIKFYTELKDVMNDLLYTSSKLIDENKRLFSINFNQHHLLLKQQIEINELTNRLSTIESQNTF